MGERALKPLAVVCAAAFFILWVMEKCEPDPRPVVPQSVRDSVEALKVRTADAERGMAIRDSIANALRDSVETAKQRAMVHETNARRLRVRGDSIRAELETAVTAADSVPILVAAVETLELRADALDAALTEAHRSLAASEAEAKVLRVSDSTSRALVVQWQASHAIQEGIVRRLEDRLRPRFPSKTEAFVGGVVVGMALLVAAANAG